MEMIKIDFQHRYLSQQYDFTNTSYKLWLYYYTVTERYDRNLPYTRPSMHETDVVVPFGSSMQHSNQFASKVRKIIYDIAKLYNITDEQMQNEKSNMSRMKQSYIEQEFDGLYNDMEFIFDYLEEMGIEL